MVLCSSIKVSSFDFPVIRLIAAGGVIVKASPSQETGGEAVRMPLWSSRVDERVHHANTRRSQTKIKKTDLD